MPERQSSKWLQLGEYDELNVMLLAECAKALSLRAVWCKCHPDFLNVVRTPDRGQIPLTAEGWHSVYTLANLLLIVSQETQQPHSG
ncbi:MAG: hypothetical protein ACE5FE_00600 [Acidiferrobacterales bacterium]